MFNTIILNTGQATLAKSDLIKAIRFLAKTASQKSLSDGLSKMRKRQRRGLKSVAVNTLRMLSAMV